MPDPERQEYIKGWSDGYGFGFRHGQKAFIPVIPPAMAERWKKEGMVEGKDFIVNLPIPESK